MRKRLVTKERSTAEGTPPSEPKWLDLEALVQIELTSEDARYPIESALTTPAGPGWRAAASGEQTLRLVFEQPTQLGRIRLSFVEEQKERTQEFVVRWSADGGRTYRDILRQQYHFSPPETTREVEDYTVALDAVTALEINIVPDIRGGDARAGLNRLQLA